MQRLNAGSRVNSRVLKLATGASTPLGSLHRSPRSPIWPKGGAAMGAASNAAGVGEGKGGERCAAKLRQICDLAQGDLDSPNI